MAEYVADVRDLKFVLFEQIGLETLRACPPFRDLDADTVAAVLDEAYKLARTLMAPANAPGDRRGAAYDPATASVRVPPPFRAIHQQYTQNGWLALAHSPEWGGQGMPVALAVAAHDLFYGACLSFCLWPLLTVGVADLVEAFGGDDLKRLYLRKLYAGEWSGTMCLTEAGAGSDVGAARTKAKKAGDHYLLEGEKIFITYGEHDMTEQICHAVLARLEGAPAGTRGLSLFLVPKYLVNPDGSLGERNDVRCAGIEHKMGIHGSPTCTMVFGEQGRCRGWLLGEENKGMGAMFQMMNMARVHVGLQGAALANAAYQYALRFARERVQGKELARARDDGAPSIPIVHHPDVRQMLMWQKATSEGLRALLLRTAYFEDLARASPEPAERERCQGLVDLLTPVCKAYASDAGFRSIELSLQTLGGYGYLSEYPVEQYLRDTKIASIYEGTNGIQALDLLGRKLPQQGGAPLAALGSMITALVEGHAGDPALGADLAKLAGARDAIVAAARHFAAAFAKDPRRPALEATAFLEAAGRTVLGWLLLEQASVALARLEQICQKAGVRLDDTAALAKLCEADSEARFYDGKVKAGQFWARRALPFVHTAVEVMTSGDTTTLAAPL